MGLAGLRVDAERLAGLSAGERAAIEDELKSLEEAVRANPLLRYNNPLLGELHPRQLEFHSPPFPSLRAFFGGNRSGKTTASVVDSLVQALDREIVPAHLLDFKRWDPPFFCRFVTPDLTSTLDGVLLQKIRDWCPKTQLHGGSFDRAFDKVQRVLRFKNGSWFQFFSNDQDEDKLGGAALHRVVYDEEPRRATRQECLTRLIDFDGEEIFAMTPLHGMSWVYDELYEPWEQGRLVDGRVVIVDMDDNPHLSQKGKARALASYTGEEREARKSGRFVSFAGLIYPQFSTSRHVVPDEDEIPAGVECFEAVDPGQRVMAAVVFCYLDFQDRLVVYDELALQGHTVQDVCKRILERRARWNVEPRWTLIDPAARNKSHQTGRSDQAEYQQHGIFTIPGQNSVTAGINRVRERLDADRLLVAASCTELRQEFKKYRWAKTSRTEDDAKERPVKKDDHLLDALRYAVMQRPLVPERDAERETDTYKDRLLRQAMRSLGRKRVPDSGFGPGVWA